MCLVLGRAVGIREIPHWARGWLGQTSTALATTKSSCGAPAAALTAGQLGGKFKQRYATTTLAEALLLNSFVRLGGRLHSHTYTHISYSILVCVCTQRFSDCLTFLHVPVQHLVKQLLLDGGRQVLDVWGSETRQDTGKESQTIGRWTEQVERWIKPVGRWIKWPRS